MKVIGLTGNIASGKSIVASMFEQLGAKIIDVDDIARKIVEPSEPAWEEIVDTFGNDILNPDNTINRKALGEIIFNDEEKRTTLNNITHPKIMKQVRDAVTQYDNNNVDAVIIEAALIVEKGGLKDLIQKLIVVISNEESQIDRLTKRNDLSKEEALSRINSQMPSSEKLVHADYVIDNSEDIDNTNNQVKNIWQEIVSL